MALIWSKFWRRQIFSPSSILEVEAAAGAELLGAPAVVRDLGREGRRGGSWQRRSGRDRPRRRGASGTWQPVLIPGLLQTPEYTRALTDASPDVMSDEAADMVVKVRQERRRVFEETGAWFAAVIWESAITGPMPFPAVHRAQLAHPNQMAKQPDRTIQVLPHAEWAAARVSPAFVGFSCARETSPELIALDTVANCVIPEGQDVMASYVQAFDTLRSASLTPRERRAAFIRQTMDSVTPESEEP
ncbi:MULTISPECIES: DUF5753 domain-containing protein [unclassified Streptomyces]|uniref:DUF5753 domain-containing protein n=1 Tax=unclassified Streptomyces TaxID=2593676 RepID=UPI00210BBFEE|nr:DUF5753 domain-containing protein [Streptomyces sp. ScaeMP-e83]